MSQPAADFQRAMEMVFFPRINAIYPGVKIYTPNAKWIEPKDEFYFAFHLMSGDGKNTNLGTQKWERTPVILHLQVYCPTEVYDRKATEMAEVGARLFAQSEFRIGPGHRVIWRAPTIKTSQDPRNGKYRVIASLNGDRDLRSQQGPIVVLP